MPPRSLYRQVERFDQIGMLSRFASVKEREHRPTLSPRLRQLIVDLKAEYPAFHLREIAAICDVAEGRRPSPHPAGPLRTSRDGRYSTVGLSWKR